MIGLAVLASHLSSGPAGPAIGLPPDVPRYYVETSLMNARPVVRSTVHRRGDQHDPDP